MQDVFRFVASGTAVALVIGAAVLRWNITVPTWVLLAITTLVVVASAALWGVRPFRRPITPNPEARPFSDQPRVGSRRWARAMFHNGLISIGELDDLYQRVPEDPADR